MAERCSCTAAALVVLWLKLIPLCAAALPPPSVVADAITADSMSLSFSFNSQYEVA